MLSRWPIRNKLLLGLALLLVIVSVLSGSSFIGIYAYRDLVKTINHRVSELPLATELSQRAGDLRLSLADSKVLRDMRDVSDGEEPATVQLARTDFQVRLMEVRTALDRYAHQLIPRDAPATAIGDSTREWNTVHKIELTLDEIDELQRSETWVLDASQAGRLDEELQRLQTLSFELPGYLHHKLSDYKYDVRAAYRTLIVLTWVATILALVLMALFVHLFYRWVFRPLRILIKGSRRVATGQFGYRIHLDTRDEMSELAEAMNAMTTQFEAIRDDLDRQVRERTQQVVRSEQLASVGFLAAGVAHEINNPLASIALCAESLESRAGEFLAADNPEREVVGKYLRMIQDEAFRCKEITSKLLDFSRMGDIERQDTDLRELVTGVIDMVRHLGKYQDKQLTLVEGQSVVVAANPQEIKQVVLNLLTNALDSVDKGGQVTVEIKAANRFAELTVADNGCGMTPEVLKHLFEPFFTRKRQGEGTGLGLSISYRIVADHNGQIDAASEGPGRGSRLRVKLPLAITTKHKELRHRYQAA
ncbi:MAG: HAMP domain-containing protein [Pirellulales bacterium]|nr:HAMP domain-containing protein [Pirellulales bacterium]